MSRKHPLPPPTGVTIAARPGPPVDTQDNREVAATILSKLPVIGGLLEVLVKQGRWRWVVLGTFLLVIYPLVLPFVCALIVTQFPVEWQKPYATTVRRAFQVDEAANDAARQSNKWLDYFQVIDNLESANTTRSYAISVEPYQRMRLRVSEAKLFTQDRNCPVPPQFNRAGTKLFTLQVGGDSVRDITNDGADTTAELSWAQWTNIRQSIDAGRITIRLVPVDLLQNVRCDELKARLRLSVEVFKDLVSRDDTAVAAVTP